MKKKDSDQNQIDLSKKIHEKRNDFDSNDSADDDDFEAIDPPSGSTGSIGSSDVKSQAKPEKSELSFDSNDDESSMSDIPEDFFGLDDDDDHDDMIDETVAAPKLISNGNGSMMTPVSQKRAHFREPLTDVRIIPSTSQRDSPISPPSPSPHHTDFNLTPTTEKSIERQAYAERDEFTIYLIRKPKELSIEDLIQMKLPVDPNTLRPKKIKIKKEDEKYEAELSTFGPQLLHAGEATTKSEEKGKNSKFRLIDNKISASILLKTKPDLSAIGPIDGEIDEDLPIQAIRREPMFEEEIKERLIPFGLKRKKRRSLPGLSMKNSKRICK